MGVPGDLAASSVTSEHELIWYGDRSDRRHLGAAENESARRIAVCGVPPLL